MPVEFLTDAQAAAHGRFTRPPNRAQLERFFFLDDVDRALVDRHRGEHNRLGFALHLGTVRFLGTFLSDPLGIPPPVVAYVAEQLRIGDASCLARYGDRRQTQNEHAIEIGRAYGYRGFAEAADELRQFLTARAWTSNESARMLFDRATVGWSTVGCYCPAPPPWPGWWRRRRDIADGVLLDLRDRLWKLLEVKLSGIELSISWLVVRLIA
jgi:hypothetical protein